MPTSCITPSTSERTPLSWLGTRRYSLRLMRVGELIEERRGHLRPSGVVNASENYFEHVISYEQQFVPQQGAGDVLPAPALGLMA